MRYDLLALFLVSSLAPAVAFAESAEAPCNLLDREALVALKLDDHKAKVEHKKVASTAGLPPQSIDLCTFTPRSAALPALTVTTSVVSKSIQTSKPFCTSNSTPRVDIATCNANVKGSIVTFMMATKPSSGAATASTFPSHIEGLIKRLSGVASKGTATP